MEEDNLNILYGMREGLNAIRRMARAVTLGGQYICLVVAHNILSVDAVNVNDDAIIFVGDSGHIGNIVIASFQFSAQTGDRPI